LRPPEPMPLEGLPPMSFGSRFSPDGATSEDFTALDCQVPLDLREFWSYARSARLFEDLGYGQWGLEILEPKRALEETNRFRARRQKDFVDGDVVVGKFLGDSDLLLMRCDTTARDFGTMLVALPLDPRNDWYLVSRSFADFLEKYVTTHG